MYYLKNLSLRDNNVSLRYKACVNINESFRLKSYHRSKFSSFNLFSSSTYKKIIKKIILNSEENI